MTCPKDPSANLQQQSKSVFDDSRNEHDSISNGRFQTFILPRFLQAATFTCERQTIYRNSSGANSSISTLPSKNITSSTGQGRVHKQALVQILLFLNSTPTNCEVATKWIPSLQLGSLRCSWDRTVRRSALRETGAPQQHHGGSRGCNNCRGIWVDVLQVAIAELIHSGVAIAKLVTEQIAVRLGCHIGVGRQVRSRGDVSGVAADSICRARITCMQSDQSQCAR